MFPGKLTALFFLFSIVCITLRSQVFEDISASAGIDFLYREVAGVGGGTAFFDYDNDGDEDLFICGGEQAAKLYRNEGDGTFSDQTNAAGLFITDLFYTTGVVSGDLDNDGYRDLFLTTWYGASLQDPEARNLLFHNNGDGTFTEMGQFAGITGGAISTGATLLDIDQDSYLDIYVTNYVDESGFLYNESGEVIGFDHDCYPNFFYHNNGDGTFTERAEELGIADIGCGFMAIGTDYNRDGQQDIYVANDFGEWLPSNALFENNGSGGFVDVSMASGADLGLYGMGIALGDYDHDLDLDIYVTNIGRNVLLANNGDGTYEDVTTAAGVESIFSVDTALATGWGTVFLDYDHDGYEDLFVANGLIPTASFIPTSIVDPDKAYRNNGDGTFSDVSDVVGFNDSNRGRGLAYADIDGDGDQDLCLIVMEGSDDPEAQVKLYRNNSDDDNHWLQVKLTGTSCNRDAIGSLVWVYAGDLVQMREISGGSSHASQNSTTVHFGLGTNESVDSIRIEWIGGEPEVVVNPPIDSLLQITQGGAEPAMVSITFELGMQEQEVSPEGVFLAGEAFGPPGDWQLTDENEDGIYTISVSREQGFSGSYVFTNGLCPDLSCAEDISGQLCADPQQVNERSLPAVMQDTVIQSCFSECTDDLMCTPVVEPVAVTFVLDMRNELTSPSGLFLAADFEDWNGSLVMDDSDGDDVWELSLELDPGAYGYYYVNGEIAEELDVVEDVACTNVEDELVFRTLLLEEEPGTIVLDSVCFNECVACIIIATEEPGGQDVLIYPSPSSHTLYLQFSRPVTDDLDIRLFNSAGQEVVRQTIAVSHQVEQLPVDHLPAGLYLVRIQMGDRVLVKRAVVD